MECGNQSNHGLSSRDNGQEITTKQLSIPSLPTRHWRNLDLRKSDEKTSVHFLHLKGLVLIVQVRSTARHSIDCYLKSNGDSQMQLNRISQNLHITPLRCIRRMTSAPASRATLSHVERTAGEPRDDVSIPSSPTYGVPRTDTIRNRQCIGCAW